MMRDLLHLSLTITLVQSADYKRLCASKADRFTVLVGTILEQWTDLIVAEVSMNEERSRAVAFSTIFNGALSEGYRGPDPNYQFP